MLSVSKELINLIENHLYTVYDCSQLTSQFHLTVSLQHNLTQRKRILCNLT